MNLKHYWTKYDVKSDNSSMSLGINNDQGLNIREESRFVWLDTFNYIQDSQVISQDSVSRLWFKTCYAHVSKHGMSFSKVVSRCSIKHAGLNNAGHFYFLDFNFCYKKNCVLYLKI